MKVKVPAYGGERLTDSERQALIDAARRYVGTRWQHMGRNAQGLDCAGLLILVNHDVQGVWVEVSDYSPWPNERLMREICNRILMPIKRDELLPGDVALLYAPGLGVVHMGWYAGKTMIHASNESNVGKVVETTIHPDWKLRGAYAVPRYEVN